MKINKRKAKETLVEHIKVELVRIDHMITNVPDSSDKVALKGRRNFLASCLQTMEEEWKIGNYKVFGTLYYDGEMKK